MNKKEAIIKYISEMNTDMLSLILDDNISYMDVPKETFVAGLDNVFRRLKNQGINEFSRVQKVHCGGNCNNGCGGFSFLTPDKQSLDILIAEENKEIKDLYTCTIFINDEEIEDKSEIYLKFYKDEEIAYFPSERHIVLQNHIDKFIAEFNQFRNNIIDIDDFFEWNLNCEKLYEKFNIYERVNFKFINQFQELVHENSYIQDLIKLHPFTKKAMDELNKLDRSNETQLIEWVLKYEGNNVSYVDYNKVNKWVQNNLILHPLNTRIVIDCTKYAASLQFSEIQPKIYWKLFEKYKVTDEQFKNAKSEEKSLQYNLETFLKIRGVYQDSLHFKRSQKPMYVEYVIGKPDPYVPFIVLAGRELGINVVTEHFGSAQSFIDATGTVQLESSPRVMKLELENEKAIEFYNKEIGLDWKSKLHTKVKELYFSFLTEDSPF